MSLESNPSSTAGPTREETSAAGTAPAKPSRKALPPRSGPPKLVMAIVLAAVLFGGAVGYEVYTSQAPSNPCASFTPAQLGASTKTTNMAATPAAPSAGPITSDLPAPLQVDRSSSRAVGPGRAAPATYGGQTVLSVVAAENFWGSLVSQLGGNDTSVISIITDPNTDPHEYEANPADAADIAQANLLIVNGVGYDDWATELYNASLDTVVSGQMILNVGYLNGVYVTGGIVTGNPHMWYNPVYVNRTVAAMYSDLVLLAPGDRSTFQSNYATLNASLAALYSKANYIGREYAGTVVASTESIFVYLANYTSLDLVSPPAFMMAVAEGNDPPAQSVVLFQCQLESGHVRVLVYNAQTVTPITTSMQQVAVNHNVTIVPVTETMQPVLATTTFQSWMGGEYSYLINALNAYELGQ